MVSKYPGAWKDQTGAYGAAIDACPPRRRAPVKSPAFSPTRPRWRTSGIARGYTLVGCGSDTTTLWEAARRQRAEIYGKRVNF